MIRNRIGQPVTGDDFFGRTAEQRALWNRLDTDHVLLLAPRRVGKTSLMQRLRDTAEPHLFHATIRSVAGIDSELEFVKAIYEAVAELEPAAPALKKIKQGPLGRLFSRIARVGLGTSGLNVEFKDRTEAAASWAELGQGLKEALETTTTSRRWLLMIDELPIFVLRLLREDPARARIFLNWFRQLRQGDGQNDTVRWLLAGSIGLDTVTARFRLHDTINDLATFNLDAFKPDEARTFLRGLSTTYNLPLDEEAQHHTLERLGWFIPFFLNLIFGELRNLDLQGAPISRLHIDQAFEALMAPSRKAHFDYWRQRLHDELGAPEDGWALRLLGAMAARAEGATRQALGVLLQRETGAEHPPEERLTYLLEVLQSDGYILFSSEHSTFRFRSPLLREYWLRRGYA